MARADFYNAASSHEKPYNGALSAINVARQVTVLGNL